MAIVKSKEDILKTLEGWVVDSDGALCNPGDPLGIALVLEMFNFCGKENTSYTWLPEWLEPQRILKDKLELMEIFSREGYEVRSNGVFMNSENIFYPHYWYLCGTAMNGFNTENMPEEWFDFK